MSRTQARYRWNLIAYLNTTTGSQPTSFASDHANAPSRRVKPRETPTPQTHRALETQRSFCEIVATLSGQFANLPAADAGQGVDEALRLIALSLPADRVALYLRTADATSFVEIACFGRAAGDFMRAGDPHVLAAEEGIEGFGLTDYPWLAGQLGKSESVCWHSIDDLPDIANAERSFFRRRRFASLLFVPMISHGALVGFLKVDSNELSRPWSTDSLALTRVMLDMVSGLLERKRSQQTFADTQARLQTTQRLEVVGRLASGIAHDFNNYLTAILGYGELLSLEMGEDGQGQDEIHEIRRAADRATALVEQILGFSRAKSHDPKLLDLNSVVALLAKIVSRIAGEQVEVVYQLGVEIRAVRVDPARFDQVILNLVANARDAMAPDGGLLTIATNEVQVDGTSEVSLDIGRASESLSIHAPAGLVSGSYVVLSVLDTGSGMSEDTRKRLFEPFYTTKRDGRGTGIGLSTVAGIVEGCGGLIVVESEIDKGSAFHLFLPIANADATLQEPEVSNREIALAQGETILLVEPECVVRGLFERVLTRWGYEVLAAEDGPGALKICATHRGPIHLVMADLAMPHLCGREIAEQVVHARPSLRVLFTSGYSEQALQAEGAWDASLPVVEKPFAMHTLAAKVREALERA
ncbi:MAG: response regulator [Myxococcales bacterium]|nr:response regulator [Myxococcales bacterium]